MEVVTGRVPTPNLPDHVGLIVKDVHKALDYLSSTYSVKSSQVVGEYSPGIRRLQPTIRDGGY